MKIEVKKKKLTPFPSSFHVSNEGEKKKHIQLHPFSPEQYKQTVAKYGEQVVKLPLNLFRAL